MRTTPAAILTAVLTSAVLGLAASPAHALDYRDTVKSDPVDHMVTVQSPPLDAVTEPDPDPEPDPCEEGDCDPPERDPLCVVDHCAAVDFCVWIYTPGEPVACLPMPTSEDLMMVFPDPDIH